VTDHAVTAQLARQAQQLDDLEQAVADLRTAPPPAAQTAAPFRWATLAEFVEHVIAPLYAQHLTGYGTWCASWFGGTTTRPGPPRGRLARMGSATARTHHWDCPVAARRRRPPDGPAPRPGPGPVPRLW